VPLDDTTVDHPRTLAAVQAAKAKIAALATAASASARAGGAFDLAASPWAGSATCLGCHVDAATQWSTTAHAHALQSLRASNRAMDDACWSCHVTGAGKPGGPTRPGDVPQALEHVGCESCHGPGRAHAASPATVHMVRQPAVEVCTGCHDGVRDEGRFDARSYLAKVAHGARP
jgi:predicted CXXCH cytochrome family protein